MTPDDFARSSVRPNRLIALIALICLSGCVTGSELPPAEPAPTFDAAAFFSGHTEGKGSLKIPFRPAETTLVEGVGHILADHTIILDQTVRRGQRPPTHREWRLRPDHRGGYVGTLTDATGAVVGTVTGNRLHLAFAMKGGLKAEQWLSLDPDLVVAHNVMVVRKLGLPVARLTEVITHVGD